MNTAPLLQRKHATRGPQVRNVPGKASLPHSTGASHALPAPVRARFEPLFGASFASVRIHADTADDSNARAFGARAFTLGQDIHFARGQYRPHDREGRALLAHELAHTLQQRSTASRAPAEALHVDPPGTPLEQEADRASDAVARGCAFHVSGAAPTGTLSRDSGQSPPAVVAPVAPTATQARTIETARRAAAVRTQVAMFRTRGIAPDTRSGRSARQEATRLARIMFEWANPNMEQVDEIVSSMVGHLTGTAQVMVAGPNDPECGNRDGYVRGHRPPIVLCPAFFDPSNTDEQRTRTMIHEAAHLAGIGTASTGEGYCIFFTCDEACPGGFDSADSWAQYVHCLSGQTPDQPEDANAPGGGGP